MPVLTGRMLGGAHRAKPTCQQRGWCTMQRLTAHKLRLWEG